jgi:two-component system nitrate/nitrite response regulator NarL
MSHDKRSSTLSNTHPRAGLAVADPIRHPQYEWVAQSSPLVLIASAVSSVRKAWREGAQAFAAVEVADHGQLLCCLTPRPPAILLLDLDLPQLGGMAGVSGLRALQPATKIVVLAGTPDEKEGLIALKLGAQGYCDRAIAPSLLGKALEAVHNGEVWVGRKLTSHLLDELSALTEALGAQPSPGDIDRRLEGLTPRERAIVAELGAGASNKEIAQKFDVSERTVKAHLTAVFRKLGISGRLQVALFMLEPSRSGPPS